jgi:anti-sigma factor RsiW
MRSEHPETELIPYLREELAAPERERVARHLEDCARCRESLEGFRGILAALRSQAPELDWLPYRVELRRKLEERSARGSRWYVPRLVPVAATAAIAALALVFALRGDFRRPTQGEDLPVFEQTAIGRHLDLLENLSVVENLDLLEDLDVVQDLDDLPQVNEG